MNNLLLCQDCLNFVVDPAPEASDGRRYDTPQDGQYLAVG